MKKLPYKKLEEALKPLSHNKDNFVDEWKIVSLSLPKTDTCACGKQHLIYNYQIRNMITGEQTIVGSECIKYFDNPDMNTIVDAVKWNYNDTTNVPINVLTRAYEVWGVITEWEYRFILSLGMKRKLTNKQGNKKRLILNKIYRFIDKHLAHKYVKDI